MRKRWSLLLAAGLALLPAWRGAAHPYASGVTNLSGAISWVLNEPATDVKIIFDNGKTTNDLGSAPVMGSNTFVLGSHTNYAIVVYKVGSNALNQISSDNNVYNNFYGPRGVAVNQSPKDCNFGRIYVANADPGEASPIRPTTTEGIYCMDAASEDCLHLGNTAATAGMTLSDNHTYSPFRLFVGTDDYLYAGDAGSAKMGGVWKVDPNLVTSVNFFGLANPSTNTTTKGTNFGRVIGTPCVTGTSAGGNLVLTFTAWDLNLTNSSGKFGSSAVGYQNIYQYNIGGGSLPTKNFPTLVTNPISLGQTNGELMDVQIAPDGKYFITATRSSASDGTTNVCVLNSAGTQVLWDSKSQSASYFHDSVNDHCGIDDYSISVSPDDKYVVIEGAVNNNFLLMSLTNGVPDISTLTTNTTVGANGGAYCYAAGWDAADNIYVTSGGSDTLRIFSLGLTTTCITSNDVTGTNGSFSMTATSAALAAIQTQPTNELAQCSSNTTFSVNASGVSLAYQWYLAGSGAIGGATNSALTLNDVTLAQSSQSYTVVVSNSLNSVTSQVAVLNVTDTIPPVVTLNGPATVSLPQGSPYDDLGATAADTCAGVLPVTTNGTVNTNVVGTYYVSYVATDPSGNSGANTRTVIVQATNGPPLIAQQPSNQVAQCTSPVVFSVIADGQAPLSYQWYDGATALSNSAAIAGAESASLTLNGALLSQAGSYTVIVTNNLSSVTSQVAALTVDDSTVPQVTVIGSEVVEVAQGTPYTDAGAMATDACVGSLLVTTNGSVNVNTPGVYVLAYTATNSGGVSGSAQRTVTVVATNGPVTVGAPNIIPLPVVVSNRAGIFTLCPPQPVPPAPARALMQILVDGASQQTGQYLASSLFKSTGYRFNVSVSTATNAVKNAILITTSNAIASLGTEGYELTVAPDSVVIRAPGQGGTFYGVQTLLQLLPPQIYSPQIVSGVNWAAPCVYVEDYPRFPWRGVMLDVARHFFNKQEVKQVLDAMAMQKFNTFHWHLVDDQGWRLQITNYPNLATVGAWRPTIDYGLPLEASTATNAAGQYGGYYTQADAAEIVAYAAERHITVVPEIEMPCHTTSALASYPQFGCGNPVGDYDMDYNSINYGVDLYSLGSPGFMAYIKDVLTEVMGIFPGKYIHCGGDEVVLSGDEQWLSYTPDITNMEYNSINPNQGDTSILNYQYWLSTNIANFLQANGRMMIGWTETETSSLGVVPNMACMDWMGTEGATVASAGLPVVMTPDSSCYVNYYETANTNLEPPMSASLLTVSSVYAFNPIPSGLTGSATNNILGAECNLWCEYVPTLENVMFRIWPRGTAMAEVTWTPQNLQNYSSFTSRLAVQKQRFAAMGVNYNHETIPQIGSWGPTVSTNTTTLNFNVTTNITAAGEVDVTFIYTNGANGLNITSVALLQNGVQVSIDSHAGFAGNDATYTIYVLHLPETKPGATYTIQAVVAGAGGASSSGSVYLPNWD